MYSKEKRREYNLARYYALKAEAIQKLGGKCVKCGSLENLQLDHIDARTKQNKGQPLLNYSKDKISAELSKCQLLCRSCHILKSKTAGDYAINRARGSAVSTAKLTEAQVFEIKALLETTTNIELAMKYGVSRRSIANIRLGVCWKHV